MSLPGAAWRRREAAARAGISEQPIAWAAFVASLLAQALGVPRLWGASQDACAIVALFFSTSVAFGSFIDEEALYSLFFPAAKGGRGLGLSKWVRALNWVVGHAVLVILLRVCDRQRLSEERAPWESTVAFICLSYLDFLYGMACAAHRRAQGEEPDLGLYTIAAGPAVVYAIFLAYVTVRLNVSFLPLIVATDSAVVFTLPLIHAMVLSPYLLSLLPSLVDARARGAGGAAAAAPPAARLEEAAAGAPEEAPAPSSDLASEVVVSASRVAYVALSMALWWLTPPLKVAMLLSQAPPQMLTEFRSLTAPPLPFGLKVAVSLLLLFSGVLTALLTFRVVRTLIRGLQRAARFLCDGRSRGAAGSGRGSGAPPLLDGDGAGADADLERDVAAKICECGWGTCFHFAERRPEETALQSALRHQYFLAGRLGVKRGAHVLDLGCGVGGPARHIARFAGVRVTAVTINRLRAERGNDLCRNEGLQELVQVVAADFSRLPFPDGNFDAVYAIESTSHVSDRACFYAEVLRVLKPGGSFACYEWCLTDRYDAEQAHHRAAREAIEASGGGGPLRPAAACEAALLEAGFRLLESRDCAQEPLGAGGDPWFAPLTPTWNPLSWPRFQFTSLMFCVTPWLLWLGELVRLLPPGTAETQAALQASGAAIARAGTEGIFTPMWLLLACRPPLP